MRDPEANSSAFTNPFIPQTGIVDDPKLFFGLEREIEQIFGLLNSGSSVALIGERGVGKSGSLPYSRRSLAKRQQTSTNCDNPCI
ncbi:MAG: ATP-binding protein [Chroococcales cyanobacterium]